VQLLGRTPNRAWAQSYTGPQHFPAVRSFCHFNTATHTGAQPQCYPSGLHTDWRLSSSSAYAWLKVRQVHASSSSSTLLTAPLGLPHPPPLSFSSLLEGSGMIVLQGAGSGNSGAIVNIWAQGYRFIRDDVRYVACR
jgi:hypothetical protein